MAAISIVASQQSDRSQLEAAIVATWAKFCKDDDARTSSGVEFGRACYELREQTKAQGSRTGEGFTDALDKLNVPRSTAYKWIGRYEVAAGISLCPPVDEVERESKTTTPREPQTGRNLQRAESHKQRLLVGIGQMRVACHGITGDIEGETFTGIDLTRALSVCSEEERRYCIDTALEIAKALRGFAKTLERGA